MNLAQKYHREFYPSDMNDCKLYLPLYRQGAETSKIYDQSGNDNHGTITGAIPTTPLGWYFDGVDDTIDLTTDIVTLGTGAGIIFWLNPSSWNTVFLGRLNNNNVYVGLISSTVVEMQGNTAGNIVSFTVQTMLLNRWLCVSIIRDSNNTRVFVNGIESSSGVQAFSSTLTINQVGKYSNGTLGYWYAGVVGEILIFNRAPSVIESRNYYELTRSIYGV